MFVCVCVCVCVCVGGGGGPGIPYIMRNKQRPHMNSINASKFGPLWKLINHKKKL